jgi:O-antigen ligase
LREPQGNQLSTFHLKAQLDVLREIVRSRWFAIADLLIVSICAAIWTLQPGVGWWPLLLALPPWITRIAAGTLPFTDLRIDLPLAIFVVTAGIGVWAAYNREAAWTKFWVIIAAILLFYALANQPRANLWLVAGYLALLGVVMAGYFLLTHDWQAQPAKIDLLNRLGFWWMSVRPTVHAQPVHPNGAAGVMAIFTPFLLAIGSRAWKEKHKVVFAFVFMGSGVLIFSFLLTTSRGAWIALSLVIGLSLAWFLDRILSGLIGIRSGIFLAVLLMILLAAVIALALLYPDRLVDLAGALPGPNSTVSRLDLVASALKLIADFPFTGGGLGAFPGLYSQYILVLPFYILPHSHNLFFDIALEQGILGLLACANLLAGAVWTLIIRKDGELFLRWAVLASLGVLVLHGFVDDLAYNFAGAPMLFVLPGMAYLLAKDQGIPAASKTHRPGQAWQLASALFLAIIFAASLFATRNSQFAIRDSLLSTWYADLGAVRMSQLELADFPSGAWDDGSQIAALTPAADLFQKALHLNPNNRTAHHRLGLIALLNRNFPTALAHLEIAHQLDPAHRGIRKTLGYTYIWADHPEQAAQLLATIPEAKQELSVYIWWWRAQSRPDLSARAEQAALILENQ